MSNSTAESEVKESIKGAYKASELEDCNFILPIDRNPQVIRFIQQVLISNPDETIRGKATNEAKYLIIQPHRFRDRDSEAIKNQIIKPLSERLIEKFNERGIKPQDRKGVQEALIPLVQNGFISPSTLQIPDIREAISEALTQSFLPSPYQPLPNQHPHLAVCAIFEQVWRHKGYTRGELINTISLAPGEQLTLEFHSWDKSTIKNEEELAQESEMRVSESLTERDSLTVVREMSKQMGARYAPNVSVSIPGVGTISGSGPDLSANINENLTKTTEQMRERTSEASQTLKNTRKMRIETSREVGREQKQTRTIANTNRCHTLNCHYFEVMSKYLVTTRLVDVLPCVLVPQIKPSISPAWVLCHEDVLRQALLSRTFLPGFDAARALETCRLYSNRFACARLITVPTPPTGDLSDDVLVSLLDDILSPYLDLQNDVRGLLDDIWDVYIPDRPDFMVDFWGAIDWAVPVSIVYRPERFRRILALALVYSDPATVNALQKLEQQRGKVSARNLLHSFFSTVKPSNLQFEVVDRQAVTRGLEALGIPKRLASAMTDWGLLDLVPDDAGLQQAVEAIDDRLAQAATMNQMARMGPVHALAPETTELPGIGDVGGVRPGPRPDLGGVGVTAGFSRMELAKVEVDFRQLKCHIEENRPHYDQAIWQRMHPDLRFQDLQEYYPAIAAIVRNEILGFVGDKAAYPVADFEEVDKWAKQVLDVSLTDLIDDIKKKYEEDYTPEPQLVTQSTQGAVLEAVVGQCDACEGFIQKSRLIDLRMQEAKAKQEESEANRFEKKVGSGDYADPQVPEAGKFILKIEKDESGQT